MKTLTREGFISILEELFAVEEPLTGDTDLSRYIRDSIDLGELIAVVKERHGVEPADLQAFKTLTALDDVFAIFTHER